MCIRDRDKRRMKTTKRGSREKTGGERSRKTTRRENGSETENPPARDIGTTTTGGRGTEA